MAPNSATRARGAARLLVAYLAASAVVLAAAWFLGEPAPRGRALLGGAVPYEFVAFALTLLGVAAFHRRALEVAVGGAAFVAVFKTLAVPGFDVVSHLGHEAPVLGNLVGLLLGFALLADHFERSGVPHRIPGILPRGAPGAFTLLGIVFVLSGFLDNIAAAMIGGVVANAAFAGRVTIGYVAAIVAAANAGGAGSVLGDTTTTMMWIAGVPAPRVAPAFFAAAVALVVFGVPAARAQARRQPMVPASPSDRDAPIDRVRLLVVALVLAGAIAANVLLDLPAAGVWAALLLGALARRPDWGQLPAAAKGAAFLGSLVLCASMMPVESLPPASWASSLVLGFVSSVFDNIPLTKLAIEQDGYDWGLLAYAVGFGGSMTWFGSSAGVAITKQFPEARRLGTYLREGWPVLLAYPVGFLALLGLLGWNPWSIGG
jgi:Na+/H+ antiporter NhaD/arsenite permease-like protein